MFSIGLIGRDQHGGVIEIIISDHAVNCENRAQRRH
jgi:hypothetical protein